MIMKKKTYATRRSIPLLTFSALQSCKRLEKIQCLLEKLSLDGIVSVLGIDSRYNDGCLQLANYLLFDFYNLGSEFLKNNNISEEELEDLIILIKKTSVSVYCCQSLYYLILPYISHWKNLQVHCLSVTDNYLKEDVDEDKLEEFKIKSFVSMLDGINNIGVPYWTGHRSVGSKHSFKPFTPIDLEKWPVIQSYALEGVGKGHFFTMHFNVVNIHDQILTIFDQCDPAYLEQILVSSFSLLERHWHEVLTVVSGTGNNQKSFVASLDISEIQVGEPLFSYFHHGRLFGQLTPESCASDTLINKPYVSFGCRTQDAQNNFKSSSAATLRDSGVDSHSLHMVIRGCSPRKPLSCIRTYFLNASDETAKQNLALLTNLYRECVRACSSSIAEYSIDWNKDKALNNANKILSNACLAYCPRATYHSKLEVYNNSASVVLIDQERNASYIKKLQVSINNIKDINGKLLGAVLYEDTFIDSSIQLQHGDSLQLNNSHFLVLTSSIPAFIMWTSDNNNPIVDSSYAKLTNVYIFSNSPLLAQPSLCDVELFDDGRFRVNSPYIPPFILGPSTVDKCTYYHTGLPRSVSLLQIHIKSSSNLPVFLSSTSMFGIGFYPQTDAWKKFSTLIIPHLEQIPNFISSAQEPDNLLSDSLAFLQKKYFWQVGILYRGDSTVKGSKLIETTNSLQPQLIDFLKHFSSSFVLGDKKVTQSELKAVLDPDFVEEKVADIVKADDQKVVITIVCGIPGSHADKLSSFLVALHKERVRWVVVKVQSMDDNACFVDEDHLQKQLTELVAKRRTTRPGAAATKKLRIIIEAVGFFDISHVVACVLNHNDSLSRAQMKIGAVTSCVNPLVCYIENHRMFPNVLEQCAAGYANNIVFTGVLEDVKDKNLASMQALIRNVNPDAAFLLAANGHVTRSSDFDLILNDKIFESSLFRSVRCLTSSLIKPSCLGEEIVIKEIKIEFSQPLLKGTFCARLRVLHNTLAPHPFCGNIYVVKGHVGFVDTTQDAEEFDLSFISITKSLTMDPRTSVGVIPAPPSKTASYSKPYHLRFYGVDLSEDKLYDWIRKCGRQLPSKKSHRSKENLTSAEKKKIQIEHQQDSLPDGVFFNGNHYISLVDNSRSYVHPCLDRLIDEYLQNENKKIDEYNLKIEAKYSADIFK